MKQNNYGGALQIPIVSGFDRNSTASDVIKGVDLTGTVAIVTGGNTGIGLETVRTLAAAGATIIVGARDMEKATLHLSGIPNIEVAPLNLIDPVSIDGFSASFLASNRPLHLLVNNAGIMWVPLRRDARGIESQLVVNYLAAFQLSMKLWPALQQAKGARVINVSSQGHQFGNFNFEDPNFLHRPYETLQAYGQSKTAMNLFTVELNERGRADQVQAFAVHPGSIGGTELAREAPPSLFKDLGYFDEQGQLLPAIAASLKTIPQGAATSVWCAISPMLRDKGGVYCEDVDIANLAGTEDIAPGVKKYSLDKDTANRLWHWSESVIGASFL